MRILKRIFAQKIEESSKMGQNRKKGYIYIDKGKKSIHGHPGGLKLANMG
jgi:hypothetical protein